MNNQTKLFGDGYKIVYKVTDLNYYYDEAYIENEEFTWRRFPFEIKQEVFILDK